MDELGSYAWMLPVLMMFAPGFICLMAALDTSKNDTMLTVKVCKTREYSRSVMQDTDLPWLAALFT